MKRRRFLTLLGAAVVAPAVPVTAAPAASATYSRYVYGLAVFHARTHAHVSARGIARMLRVTPTQARAMIGEMTSAGLVKPVGMSGTHVRAVSNILRPDAWGLDVATRKARSQVRRARSADRSHKRDAGQPDISALLAHLRQMCVSRGMTVSPHRLAG